MVSIVISGSIQFGKRLVGNVCIY